MPRKQRLQVDLQATPPGLATVAAPTGTFVQKPQYSPELLGLARGLQAIAGPIAGLGEVVHSKMIEDQTRKGQQLAVELNEKKIAWKEAVDKGLVPANASPWFMAALKERLGNLMGSTRYASDLRVFLDSQESLKTTTEMDDFDNAVVSFNEEWSKQIPGELLNDKYFGRALGNMRAAALQQERNRFASQLGGRAQDQLITTTVMNLGVEASQMLENGASLEQIGSQLGAFMSIDMQGLPVDKTAYNQAMAGALFARALATNDMRYADLTRHIPVQVGKNGKGAYLFDIPSILDKYAEVRNQIARQKSSEITMQQQQERAAQVEFTRKGLMSVREMVTASLADGRSPLSVQFTPEFRALIDHARELGQPLFEDDALDYLEKAAERTDVTDPYVFQHLQARIALGDLKTPQEIFMFTQRLSNIDEAKLLRQLDDQIASGGKGITSDPLVRDALSRIDVLARARTTSFPNEAAADAFQAEILQEQFISDYLSYLDGEGATASTEAKRKWAVQRSMELGSQLIERDISTLTEDLQRFLHMKQTVERMKRQLEVVENPESIMDPQDETFFPSMRAYRDFVSKANKLINSEPGLSEQDLRFVKTTIEAYADSLGVDPRSRSVNDWLEFIKTNQGKHWERH